MSPPTSPSKRLCDRLDCNGTNKFDEECPDSVHYFELQEAKRYWK